MRKKMNTQEAIKYYCLPQLAILGIALLICGNFIATVYCNLMNIREYDPFYKIIHPGIKIALAIVWIGISFYLIREKRYTAQTGRRYSYDAGRYKRTYYELVDYFKDAEPHKLDTSDFPIKNWKDATGIVFGMDKDKLVSIPSNCEANIAVFGPVAAGKTSGLAIINAMCFEGSTVIVDIKNDIYSYVSTHSNRKILRFCPDNPNALQESVHFDPFAGIKEMDETNLKLYLESMATVLIPDDGGSSSDGNYFTSRARKMFQGITHLILFENEDASFPDVIHIILQGNIFEFVTKAIDSDCEAAKEMLASFYGNSEKNVSSAFDALTTALVHFSNPVLDELLSNKGKCVSMQDLDDGYDFYLQISQEHLDAYAPLFTLILQSLSTQFTKRPDSTTGIKNRPILMVLDEFPQLTFSYKLINSNLSTLRSKSIVCMIIQQGYSQLEQRYEPAGARSLISNCSYQVILGSNDIQSSKTFSDLFGMKKILKISNSLTNSKESSSSRSVQEATERVFPPEYFGDLPLNKKLVLYFKGKYREIDKLNCYTD